MAFEIAAFDVHYPQDGRASAAAILFSDYGDPEPILEYTGFCPEVAGYIPGEFFRRELPALLALLKKFDRPPDEVIIDGYVLLGDKPGLGYHLFRTLGNKTPVIGVAKSKYKGAVGIKVLRGKSTRPLYVTAAGMDRAEAAEKIRRMHGWHRIPTLLQRVDRSARAASAER